MLQNGYHAKQIYLLVQTQLLEKAKIGVENLKEELHIEESVFTKPWIPFRCPHVKNALKKIKLFLK